MRNPNRALAHSWMNRPVRVLNATYEYLGEVSANRAIVLIATGSAQSAEDVIPIFPVRSKHVEIPLPEDDPARRVRVRCSPGDGHRFQSGHFCRCLRPGRSSMCVLCRPGNDHRPCPAAEP